MDYSYFDLNLARSLLKWLREKLVELSEITYLLQDFAEQLDSETLKQYSERFHHIVSEITSKGIILRDPRIGLVDFPAIINNRPAYLCWKLDEDDIKYWHYAEEGFKGRKTITGKEEILSFL
jgi:hypothetical protein